MGEAPKNIRQVGYIDRAHKIYVEDYVITFTKGIGNTLCEENSGECRAAVLLGRKNIDKTESVTYINGMVLIDSFTLSGEAAFSNERWSKIYDKIKEFYEEEEIVGWLYIGSVDPLKPDRRLINIHSSNFAGKNLIFMSYDYDEKEEIFYDFYNNSFVKRNGFYIYYQKNETMHNYMLSINKPDREKPAAEEKVVQDIRAILSERQANRTKGKLSQYVYAAGMLVAAAVLLVGTTVIYRNNSKPENDDELVSVMSEHTQMPAASSVPDLPSGMPQATDVPIISSEITATDEPSPTESPVVTDSPAASENNDKNNNPEPVEKSVTTTTQNYSFYIVKNGDSLSRISEKIFSSVKYVDEIKRLNNIENEDMIYEGQKLLLPDK